MRTRRIPSPLPRWTALLALVISAAGASPQAPPRFEEEVSVREATVVVELPAALRDDRLRPEDFLVFVDGRLRRLTRAEPLGDDDAWELVVYVDRVLAKPDTAFPALLALAGRSDELARLGPVAVAVADPSPRAALAGSREAPRIRQVLADLAGEARIARQRPPEAPAPSSSPDALRRQLDRLVTWLAARPPAGPRALFLVTGDFGDFGGSPDAAVVEEAARLLAAQGWVTVALPFRAEPDADPGAMSTGVSDLERFRQAPVSTGDNVPPVIPGRPPKPTQLRLPRVIDLFVLPDLAPLRALVQPTAGTVVGYAEQLGFVLAGLGERWLLAYEAAEAVDGRLQPLEVKLLETEVAPRAQRWVRSSTPEGVAAARLRLRLGGGTPAPGSLPLEVSLAEDGSELRLAVAPFRFAGSAPSGPVRISLAFDPGDGTAAQIRHVTVPGIERPDRGWRHALPLRPPPGARRVAVGVEDLARQRWGAAVADLGPGRRSPPTGSSR